MDPVTPATIYQGCSSIYKSTNSGSSWTNIGNALFSTTSNNSCEDIAIAPSDVSTIYACSFNKIVKTTNGGTSWTTITGTLPVSTTAINQIAISYDDPNKVWICLGGYSSGNKVFKSIDGGTTWTNVSGTIPNIPVNTIVYQNGSSDRLFIGTDIGVYSIDNTVTDWVYFSRALPNVLVHELEINYGSNKLVAATYGRGIWQIDLPAVAQPNKMMIAKVQPGELKASVFPNPTTGLVNIQVMDAKQPISIEVYKLTGEKVASYNYDAVNAGSIKMNISNQPFGNYILRIKSGDAATSKTIQLVK